METKYIVNNVSSQTITGDLTINGNVVITGTTNTRPYKVYTALLTQEGSQAPVATVLENTIGNLEWSYRSDGYYELYNIDGPFTFDKTFINNNILGGESQNVVFNRIINQNGSEFDVQKGYTFEYRGLTSIRLKTYSDAGVLANDILGTQAPLCVEIRVYN
jgi:hypothetical protein